MSRAPFVFIGVAVVAFLALAPAAWGSVLDVNPIRVHLKGSQRSETLRLRNRSNELARYQVIAYSWRETPAGKMELQPTGDLVVFPSLIEIQPGKTRRIKIAPLVRASHVELSYRVFLEPLPEPTNVLNGIKLLTRIGIPVFVQPQQITPQPEVSLQIHNHKLYVTVANLGNSYFMSRSVQLVGRDQHGGTALNQLLSGWYVLAGGRRVYELPLQSCGELSTIRATLKTDHGVRRRNLNVQAQHCSQ